MKRALTGIRATGEVHIGNYLGMIRPALELQQNYECFYFIADLHSLTTQHDRKILHESTYDIAATWLAFGLDIERHLLYRQSDLPQVTELAWYLSCFTGMGFLKKAHSFKDAVANEREVNHGVFYYPVLMAADILLYDADLVPVGKDQKQHVEMARDMAQYLNTGTGHDLLKLPEVMIRQEVMVVPGLDGRKMSKSYGNTIPVLSPSKQLRKKVMSLKTDSTPLDEPKKLKGSLLGDLFVLFATPEEVKDLEQRLANGGLGWGHAKEELFEVMDREISPARERYSELRSDIQTLENVLQNGRERAAPVAETVLSRVRNAFNFAKR